MKTLLTLTCAIGLVSCSSYEQVATRTAEAPPAVSTKATTSVSSKSASALEREIHVGINEYRGTLGKKQMTRNKGLDALARQHSEFMMRNAGKFNLEGKRITHYGFSSRAARARHELGIGTLAENVIAGWNLKGPMSENFVTGWINSPNHLHNIKGSWSTSGVGVAIGPDGAVYATQLFGVKQASFHERFAVPDVW